VEKDGEDGEDGEMVRDLQKEMAERQGSLMTWDGELAARRAVLPKNRLRA
jgi:hypothetical protein